MRFSYHPCMCPPDQYLELARAAEDLGFSGFTLPDSICYPEQAETKYPYNADGSRNFLEDVPFIEPFSLIPALAAVTSSLVFTTSVMKLAIRHPVLVAKSVTSINAMFNNRFVFGVGLSPWIEDFEICGERWAGRGKRLDEMIAIIRGLHSGDYFGFKGEYYDIPPHKMCPVPGKPTAILIGGHSEAALKRAARIGDGWIHAGGNYQSLKEFIDKINTYRKEYGRDGEAFDIQAATADAFSVEGVQKLEGIGITECSVGFRDPYTGQPDTKDIAQKIAEMKWFSENIIAKCA